MSERALKLSNSRHSLRVNKGSFHLSVAVVLMPAYLSTGYSLKLAVAPYILYLVLSRRVTFLPALLVHFVPGTMVSQFILMGCVISCALNVDKLKQLGLIRPFTVTMLGLLALLPVFFERALLPSYSIVSLGQDVALYLGLFGFFWATTLKGEFTAQVSRQIFLILLVCLVLQVLPSIEGTIRYYFIGLPLFAAVVASYPFAKNRISYPMTLLVIAGLGMVVSLAGQLTLTFTVVGSAVATFALILGAAYGRSRRFVFPLGGVLALIVLGTTTYVITSADNQRSGSTHVTNLEDVQSAEELMPAVLQKTFGDRAPLWAGTWEAIVERNQWWPPIRPLSAVTFTSRSRLEERDYGAHNIVLELLRQYGLIVGFLAIAVYLGIVVRGSALFLSRDPPAGLVMLSASAVGCLVVGGISGQFVLMNNFSLVVMSMAGIAFSMSDVCRKSPESAAEPQSKCSSLADH